MDIFSAAKVVKQHILGTIEANVVQTTGIVAYGKGEFLHFKSKNEAVSQVGSDGYVFSYIYRNGQLELTPEG